MAEMPVRQSTEHEEKIEHEEKMAFACKVGGLIEECGHPRIAGHIVGWLLVSDPPEQSFNDLVETLEASKGSISTMTRRLERAGLIERISRPGDRQTYFRIRPGAWRLMLRRELRTVSDLCDAAEEGLALMDDEPPCLCRRLEEMHDFYAFAAEKMPALVEEYEATQEAGS